MLALGLLAACGQKGPLYLPSAQPASAAHASGTTAPHAPSPGASAASS